MSARFAALSLVAASLAACSTTVRTDSATAMLAAAPAERVAGLKAFEQEIEDAVARRDHGFLDRVTAPTFIRTHPDGRVEDRAAVMGQIRQPPPNASVIRRTIDPATQQVQLHGDIAVTRGDLEVRGPRRVSRMQYLRVYRWQASGWRLLSMNILSVAEGQP